MVLKNLLEKMKLRYIFWLARRLPDCEQTTRMMSDSMDQDLPLKERVIIRLHMHVCQACKLYRKQLQLLRQVIRRSASIDQKILTGTDTSLSLESKQRMKRSLSAD